MTAEIHNYLCLLLCMAVVQPVFTKAVYSKVNHSKQKNRIFKRGQKHQPKKLKQQQADYFLIAVLFSLLMIGLIVLGAILAITLLWIIGVIFLSLVVILAVLFLIIVAMYGV